MFAITGVSLIGLPNFAGRYESVVSFVFEAAFIVVGALLAVEATRRAMGGSRGPVGGGLAFFSPSYPLSIAVVLIVVASVGQLAKYKPAYPFMPFRMYGGAKVDDAVFLKYMARHRSGERRRFRPSTIISSLGAARVGRGLARRLSLMRAAAIGPVDALTDEQRLAFDVLRTLMRMHNSQHPEDPVDEVEIVRVTLTAPFRPSARTETVVGRVEAGGS